MSEDARRLIDAYNDAWNRQDLDAVMSMHTGVADDGNADERSASVA